VVHQIEEHDVMLPGGGRIHYRTAGTGSIATVFLHGYTFSSAMWTRVLETLPAGYCGYAIDIRGFGLSHQPDNGYSFAELGAEVLAFMDALQIGKAVLVGQSMGGMVLQTLALTHPERALAFVLTDCMAMTQPAIGLLPRIQTQIDSYGTADANLTIFAAATPRFFDKANITDAELAAFVDVNLQAGNAALKQVITHVFSYEQIDSARYATIMVPSLIVIGSHDLIPFAAAVSLNDALPNSEIFIVERSGHTPMWEAPERWNAGVFGFLQRHVSSSISSEAAA
jgi:3-oxoadipate enol-lactonase